MTTFEALEDAAIRIETLKGSNTGVFASIFERSYDRMGHKDLSTISRTHLNGTGESSRFQRCPFGSGVWDAYKETVLSIQQNLILFRSKEALHDYRHRLRKTPIEF